MVPLSLQSFVCERLPSTYRKRKLPSGRPIEKITSFKQGDPTWRSEYLFFKDLIKKNKKNNLKRDIILNKEFAKIKKYNFI